MQKNNFKIVELKLQKDKNTTKRTVLIKDFFINEIIGIHEHEKINKQKIVFNIIITVNQDTLPDENNLSSIVDYEKITNKLKKLANIKKYNFLESLAEDSFKEIFADKRINSVKIIGNPKNKAGVISFTIKGVHPHDIATILDENGIAIRAGHHCCQILHERLNLVATARASFGVYNTKEDIDVLCEGIENCRKVFDLK